MGVGCEGWGWVGAGSRWRALRASAGGGARGGAGAGWAGRRDGRGGLRLVSLFMIIGFINFPEDSLYDRRDAVHVVHTCQPVGFTGSHVVHTWCCSRRTYVRGRLRARHVVRTWPPCRFYMASAVVNSRSRGALPMVLGAPLAHKRSGRGCRARRRWRHGSPSPLNATSLTRGIAHVVLT